MIATVASPRVSIVTATFNVAAILPGLIKSLVAQTDQEFEWVVADGDSTDETGKVVDQAKICLQRVVVNCQKDFGIYDALNRGVRLATGDYYLVLGADDTLEPDAIANYKRAIVESGADFITARVASGNSIRSVRAKPWAWLYGQFAYVSAHAVGLAIRRDLHQTIGYYSRKFPIAADQLFILQAVRQGATVSQQSFVAGTFDSFNGTSSRDVLGTLTEGFRVQVLVGQSLPVQLLLLLIRILKNLRSIRSRH